MHKRSPTDVQTPKPMTDASASQEVSTQPQDQVPYDEQLDADLAKHLAKTATFNERTVRGVTLYDITHKDYNKGPDHKLGSVRRVHPYTKHSRWVFIHNFQCSTTRFKTRQLAAEHLFLRIAEQTT